MAEEKHIGFKGTAKFVGWMIGLVVIIFDFLVNWIPAKTIGAAMIAKILIIAATAGLGVPAIFYIADAFWSLADKVKEKIFA